MTMHRWCPLPLRARASASLERDLAATQWEVSASVDISLGDECLVRPNVGRDVAARTVQFDEQVPHTLMDGE